MTLDFIEIHRQKYFCTAHYLTPGLPRFFSSRITNGVNWPLRWIRVGFSHTGH